MTTATLPVVKTSDSGADDRPVHLVCCDEDKSMCGQRLTGPNTDDAATCVVCIDLKDSPCDEPDCHYRAAGLRRLYYRARGWI